MSLSKIFFFKKIPFDTLRSGLKLVTLIVFLIISTKVTSLVAIL